MRNLKFAQYLVAKIYACLFRWTNNSGVRPFDLSVKEIMDKYLKI